MIRFISICNSDKENVKMINKTDKGFDLVILSDEKLNEILNIINDCDQNDELYIAWQNKFKHYNFEVYRNCIFSTPIDNVLTSSVRIGVPYYNSIIKEIGEIFGKKIKVEFSNIGYYTESVELKNRPVKFSSTERFKDGKLLSRMLKIGELNLKSQNDEL